MKPTSLPTSATHKNPANPLNGIVGKKRYLIRATAIAVAALGAWHITTTFLWIAPPNRLSELIPGGQTTIRSYTYPLFQQSWSVFAPSPINGNYDLKVRATTKDGKETSWISAADAEQKMITHNLFPPRASSLAFNLAKDYKKAWDGLSAEQKKKAELNYVNPNGEKNTWLNRLNSQLQKADKDASKISSFVTQERKLSAYATQVAYVAWGKENIYSLQFQVSRQTGVPFKKRNDPNAQPPAPKVINTGWRAPTVLAGQNSENFADVFEELIR